MTKDTGKTDCTKAEASRYVDITHAPLRLIAKKLDDLQIISAHLQDALIPLTSITHNQEAQSFHLLANRFCWEHPHHDHDEGPLYHRVHTGINFHNVDKVHHRGFNQYGEVRALNLLAVHAEKSNANEAKSHYVHLICSDHHEIRLHLNDLHCHIGDIDHPWPTHKKPTHLYEHLDRLAATL